MENALECRAQTKSHLFFRICAVMRALTGNQKRGDAYVRSLLEAIVADESVVGREADISSAVRKARPPDGPTR